MPYHDTVRRDPFPPITQSWRRAIQGGVADLSLRLFGRVLG